MKGTYGLEKKAGAVIYRATAQVTKTPTRIAAFTVLLSFMFVSVLTSMLPLREFLTQTGDVFTHFMNVTLTRDGQDKKIKATTNLLSGDVFAVGENGALRFNASLHGSRWVELGGNTSASIETLNRDDGIENFKLLVDDGAYYCDVQTKLGDSESFEVAMNDAAGREIVVVVTGTKFGGSKINGDIIIQFLEGSGNIYIDGVKSGSITANEQLTISADMGSLEKGLITEHIGLIKQYADGISVLEADAIKDYEEVVEGIKGGAEIKAGNAKDKFEDLLQTKEADYTEYIKGLEDWCETEKQNAIDENAKGLQGAIEVIMTTVGEVWEQSRIDEKIEEIKEDFTAALESKLEAIDLKYEEAKADADAKFEEEAAELEADYEEEVKEIAEQYEEQLNEALDELIADLEAIIIETAEAETAIAVEEVTEPVTETPVVITTAVPETQEVTKKPKPTVKPEPATVEAEAESTGESAYSSSSDSDDSSTSSSGDSVSTQIITDEVAPTVVSVEVAELIVDKNATEGGKTDITVTITITYSDGTKVTLTETKSVGNGDKKAVITIGGYDVHVDIDNNNKGGTVGEIVDNSTDTVVNDDTPAVALPNDVKLTAKSSVSKEKGVTTLTIELVDETGKVVAYETFIIANNVTSGTFIVDGHTVEITDIPNSGNGTASADVPAVPETVPETVVTPPVSDAKLTAKASAVKINGTTTLTIVLVDEAGNVVATDSFTVDNNVTSGTFAVNGYSVDVSNIPNSGNGAASADVTASPAATEEIMVDPPYEEFVEGEEDETEPSAVEIPELPVAGLPVNPIVTDEEDSEESSDKEKTSDADADGEEDDNFIIDEPVPEEDEESEEDAVEPEPEEEAPIEPEPAAPGNNGNGNGNIGKGQLK